MRFNNLSHEEKLDLQKYLVSYIDKIGGKNNFLSMLEDIREPHKHPLTNKTGKCHFKTGTINWDKHIFEDKIETLKQVSIVCKEENILLLENDKLKKQLLNTIRTMVNLEFKVQNKNTDDGEGFSFKAFDIIDEDNIEFNPLFQIVFLDSVNLSKTIIKYK